MTVAIVMAGGKGTRMNVTEEKPMIKVKDKPMIQYVIEALLRSKHIEKVLVAISPNTPKTHEFIKDFPVDVVDTPGKGYIEDLSYILSNRKYVEEDEVVMTIVADLPFVTSELIDEILDNYYHRKKPAMCVSVPEKLFDEYKITPTLSLDGLVPTGVNLVLANTKEQDQTIYISNNIELAFNINTINDLILSRGYIKKKE